MELHPQIDQLYLRRCFCFCFVYISFQRVGCIVVREARISAEERLCLKSSVVSVMTIGSDMFGRGEWWDHSHQVPANINHRKRSHWFSFGSAASTAIFEGVMLDISVSAIFFAWIRINFNTSEFATTTKKRCLRNDKMLVILREGDRKCQVKLACERF